MEVTYRSSEGRNVIEGLEVTIEIAGCTFVLQPHILRLHGCACVQSREKEIEKKLVQSPSVINSRCGSKLEVHIFAMY